MNKLVTNYTSIACIKGMLSKRYKPTEDWSGFWKNSKHFVTFDSTFNSINIKKISYSYILEKQIKNIEKYKSCFRLTLLHSIFNDEFFELKNKKFREIRETKNKYNKICYISTKIPKLIEINNLLNYWDEVSGKKYGWTRHSGIDRNFFDKYYKEEEFIGLFFYIDQKLVGYSIMSKKYKNLNNNYFFDYIIRKNDIKYRNLTLYIDYKIFEYIYNNYVNNFIVNFGGSSGNLLKYKMKFPIYNIQPIYFITKENNV